MKSTTSPEQTNSHDTPRLLWIFIAALSIIYIAGIFLLFSFSAVWRGAQPYAELIIQHPSLIRFSTFVLCSGCAWFLFWPREGTRFIGRWSDYVAFAFATFAVQYGLRFTELKLEGIVSPAFQSTFHDVSSFVVYVCSALNNLLFLAASRILLNKNKVRRIHVLEENPRIFFQFNKKLRNALVEFQGAIPRWALVAAMFGPLALLDSRSAFVWARFPDALFSVCCLSWFGYAVAVNLNMRRRKVLAATAMLIALTYGGMQLVYATNPIIASSTNPNGTLLRPGGWIREVGTRADQLAQQTNKQTGRLTDKTIHFLDNAVYALLLPLKLALFLPAFSLYLLFVISSLNDLRPALFDSISRRKDYLSSDGILSAIGKAIGANRVQLYVRIPGTQELQTGREERALPMVWNSDGYREKPNSVSINSHPRLKRIMKDEGSEILSDPTPPLISIHTTSQEPPWLVPIRFHGGVIGALQADLAGDRKNHTTLQKFRLMSDLIAPSVQDYRALAALDQMGFRFTRLQVDHPNESFSEATRRMADVMHDILSPLASGLIIEIGFTSIHHFQAEREADEQLLKDQENESWLEDEEFQLIGKDRSIRLEKSKTSVKSRQHRQDGSDALQIGGLMFTIPAEKDQFNVPTLAAYYLNRKAVSSLVADGIFDVARGFFSEIIKNLALDFSTEPLSDRAWFETVQSAVKRSGIRWLVAQPHWNGSDAESRERIMLHSNLSERERASLFAQRLATAEASSLPAPGVVEVWLRKSKYRLWLGIERYGFGPELEFESPWKIFLEDLAAVADAALDSMHKKREAELARQDQGVMTIAVMTGTLTHQILGLLGNQVQTTEAMEEEARQPSVHLTENYKNLYRNLRTSALNGRELTEAFGRITKVQDSGPCNMSEAAQEALKLHRLLLTRRQILVTIDPTTDIVVNVPFFVAAFALANLVGNASDAIRFKGSIVIEAKETEDSFVCHVTNNGPEIRQEMRDKIFEFGATDKPGHNGWGLYYVQQLLIQSHGHVQLAHSDENSTRFTVTLSKESIPE